MRKSSVVLVAAAGSLLLGALPARAASDYLLQLDGVRGESATKGQPAPIEVASWSFGASNPTSVGSSGMSAGKASVQDLSVMSSPRDVASGQASGKRSAQAVASGDAASAAPAAGTVSELTLRLRESPTRASTGKSACTAGQHIDKVTLSSNGQSYELTDATVTACDVSGGETVMKVRGKTGHVTLMK